MADPLKDVTCGVCRHFIIDGCIEDDEHSSGQCHRRSPVVGKRGNGVWPNVWAHESCGEFAVSLRVVDLEEV